MLSYGPKELGISRQTILLSILVACVLDIVSVPYASMIADRIGTRKMLIYGSVYMAAIAYPFFWLLSTGTGAAVLLAMILIITIGHAVTYSAVAGYVTGLFPAEVRYTARPSPISSAASYSARRHRSSRWRSRPRRTVRGHWPHTSPRRARSPSSF